MSKPRILARTTPPPTLTEGTRTIAGQPRWLERNTVPTPHMILCLSEKDFLKAAKDCQLQHPGPWIDSIRHTACVHTWQYGSFLACVVCVNPDAVNSDDPLEVTLALVHESVHVFQQLCEMIGEDSPSYEFEAYSIEQITSQLLREYARRVTG